MTVTNLKVLISWRKSTNSSHLRVNPTFLAFDLTNHCISASYCVNWQLGTHSPGSFNAHSICLFHQFVLTRFSLFHRSTHWMGRRIYFRGCTMLYKVSLTPPHDSTCIQINSKHVAMIAAYLIINWNLFVTSSSLWMKDSFTYLKTCCMAINLEPLYFASVLWKPIAKVNDYTQTLCKYSTDIGKSVVAVFLRAVF